VAVLCRHIQRRICVPEVCLQKHLGASTARTYSAALFARKEWRTDPCLLTGGLRWVASASPC
jgi:hypothetical protein